MIVLAMDARPSPPGLSISALAEAHYEQVFRFCSLRLGYHRAGDATQETFLSAQKSLSKFRGDSKPLTWLLGIANHHCQRIIRSEKFSVPLLELSAQTPDPSETAIDREALRTALSRLSDEHREVVILHEISGLTYGEIASALNIPIGTVKSRLHNAFVHLRESMRSAFPSSETATGGNL